MRRSHLVAKPAWPLEEESSMGRGLENSCLILMVRHRKWDRSQHSGWRKHWAADWLPSSILPHSRGGSPRPRLVWWLRGLFSWLVHRCLLTMTAHGETGRVGSSCFFFKGTKPPGPYLMLSFNLIYLHKGLFFPIVTVAVETLIYEFFFGSNIWSIECPSPNSNVLTLCVFKNLNHLKSCLSCFIRDIFN